MITAIKGILFARNLNQVIVATNSGLHYEIEIGMRDYDKLPEINENIFLFTHFIVREDANILYGFLEEENRDCFRILLKISGVGPRIAIAILSTFTVYELQNIIIEHNKEMLSRVSGIGPKMAERLLLELKGKISFTCVINSNYNLDDSKTHHFKNDVITALTGLGFTQNTIMRVVNKIPPEVKSSADAIKFCLQIINR